MSQTEEKKPPTVFAACKRGTDKATEGQSCDGRQVSNLTPPGAKYSSFKCLKCGYAWMVPQGGQFSA